MTTYEIVQALAQNQLIRQAVPAEACPTIPYPFFRNGVPCLGFYFYMLSTNGHDKLINPPLIQVVTTYPSGNIIHLSSAPFFYPNQFERQTTLGKYPGKSIKQLSYSDSTQLYKAYYTSCDNFLLKGDKTNWEKIFNQLQEEGMGIFFQLFAANLLSMIPSKEPHILNNTKKEKATEDLISYSANHRKKTAGYSAAMKHLHRDLRNFFSNSIFSKEAKDLEKLITDVNRDNYNIAVIGEFSRGKTTFINKLLNINCLPVGMLPTTAVLTKISDGSSPKAFFISKDRKIIECKPELGNLEDFSADVDGHDPEGVLQIITPISWLQDKNIVFFDTPGTGDSIGTRAVLTRNTIDYCDCTIMTISAQAACSETEMEFLRENVILKSVPQCIVLITKLDTIPEKERMRVIQFIKDKMSSILPSTQYWISEKLSGIEDEAISAQGIENIRSSIIKLYSSDEEAWKMRQRQFIARLSLIFNQAKADIKLIEQAEKLSDEEKLQAIKKLEYNQLNIDLIKDKLLLNCQKMEYEACREIIDQITERMFETKTSILHSLKVTKDPKMWHELEFPNMVTKSIKQLKELSKNTIGHFILTDQNKLYRSIQKDLSCKGFELNFACAMDFSNPLDEDLEIKDFSKIQKILRPVSLVGAILVSSGIGMGAGIATAMLNLGGEFAINKMVQKQKEQLSKHIGEKYDCFINDTQNEIKKQISESYKLLVDEINNEMSKVIEKAIKELKSAKHKIDSPKQSRDLLAQIDNFKLEISKKFN